jgi:hypothetical protein
MRKTVLAAFGLTCGLAMVPSYAQNLQMVDAPSVQTRVETPGRGLSMAQVERKFGAPTDRVAAVGQPPIARWVYPSFVVYFERNLVIHAVATQPAAQP